MSKDENKNTCAEASNNNGGKSDIETPAVQRRNSITSQLSIQEIVS